jgi:hypothetical protein
LYRQAAGDAWDVFGVLLPNCHFVAGSPRFADRVMAKAIQITSRLAFRALVRRRLQKRVRVEGPLYLSNVVVLEKSQCVSTVSQK